MKKSIFWGLCSFVLGIIVVTGCSYRNSQNPSLKIEPEFPNFTVLSTTRMIHDGVQKIGGNVVHAVVLMDGPVDPHSYELVKGDGDKISQADLVFANGLGLEHSLSLKKALKSDSRTVFLGDLLFERHPEWFISDGGVLDPHIWLDLHLWTETIDDIVRSLSEKMPLYAKEFDERGRELKNKMSALDSWSVDVFKAIPEKKRFLITGHDAFRYFTRRYLAPDSEKTSDLWRLRCTAPEGVSPEAQIGFKDIARVACYAIEHEVDIVFPESGLNKEGLKKVVSSVKNKRNIRLSESLIYSDSVASGGVDFLDTFRHNVRVISEGLAHA